MDSAQPQDWKTDSGIVSWEHAVFGLGIPLRNVFHLTLADGTATFGCALCPHTAATPQGITVAHLRKEHGVVSERSRALAVRRAKEVKEATDRPSVDLMTLPMSQVLALARKAASQTPDSEWKRRAKKAEGDLAALRALLGGKP